MHVNGSVHSQAQEVGTFCRHGHVSPQVLLHTATLAFLSRWAELSYFLQRAQGTRNEVPQLLSPLQRCKRELPPRLTLPLQTLPSSATPPLSKLPWGYRACVRKHPGFRGARAGINLLSPETPTAPPSGDDNPEAVGLENVVWPKAELE